MNLMNPLNPMNLKTSREYIARGGNAVERCGKTGVNRHLLEDVHDLLARGPCGARRPHMIFQRPRMCPDCREKRDRRQLARHWIERSLTVRAAAQRLGVSARDSLHLIDLVLLGPDVQRRIDVPFQLRLRVPESAQRRNRTEPKRPQIETGT